IGGILVGLSIGGLGLADRTGPTPPHPPTPATASVGGSSFAGLVDGSVGPNRTVQSPIDDQIDDQIDDIVTMWQERAERQPLDYLSRTQLGRALSRRARQHADLDDHERAEQAHLAALELNPHHRPARVGLIAALSAQHRFAEARQLAEDVLIDEPGALDVLALAGDAAFELGDYDAASANYAQLATTGIGSPAELRLARLAAVQVSPVDAAAIVARTIVETDLESLSTHDAASHWFQLARHRFDAGDSTGALEALDAALAIDHDHPGATETLPFVLASVGRVDEALVHYEALVVDGAAPDVEGLYADLLRRAGRGADAEVHEQRATEAAIGLAQRYPAERRHLVGFYLTRDPELAVDLARADLAERADIGGHDALAWALFHTGRFDEAAAAMAPAVAGPAIDASLRYHAAAIAAAVGDLDEARHHLRVARATNPDFHPTEAADAMALATRLGLEI
ncbi:MAG: tetratricopeptide repeat protein, partial [Acidimicrobiia bacterium]|nr:tetratricopeptide repeat protein [Acidimicrobiia bacterium]